MDDGTTMVHMPALIAPARLSELVAGALESGHADLADRFIPDAITRVLGLSDTGALIGGLQAEPPTTGNTRYDTLIATAFAWALNRRGVTPVAWMTKPPALDVEWLWDGDTDASPEFRDYIRRQTPEEFRAKGLLLRERDLRAA